MLKSILKSIYRALMIIPASLDKIYLSKDVPTPKIIGHETWRQYLYENGNKPNMRILEIGSREVTGTSVDRQKFDKATYVGFDYYAGNNVDVVGDVHKLSSYFKDDEKFDIVYTSACFEHFAMPWVAAQEIAKVLKVGGIVLVETHFSFSSHERPWHFFQFSDMALRTLFNRKLGFECLDAGMVNPIVGRFSRFSAPYLRYRPVAGLYCHILFLGKKVEDNAAFEWGSVDLNEVVGDLVYPEPKR